MPRTGNPPPDGIENVVPQYNRMKIMPQPLIIFNRIPAAGGLSGSQWVLTRAFHRVHRERSCGCPFLRT